MELSFAEKENGRENKQYHRDLIGYSMNYVPKQHSSFVSKYNCAK